MPFDWLVYLLWFWFYDSQVKTALFMQFAFGTRKVQRLNQSHSKGRSKVKIPALDGQEERLSPSKLKQAFLINSDAELFISLIQCIRIHDKFDV